ncbi:glycogen synthase GlgA [Lacunisphaera limnophila]|nr:glycogen synthase GlgA [Lacunisphaera limnophila]
MKILFVTPEVEPFVKVGGLADMTGALPKDLVRQGHDVRVVCPAYGSVRRVGDWQARPEPLGVDVGGASQWARVWETVLPGSRVPAYFLENHDHFARPEVYTGPWGAHADNDLRFAFFCRGALALCQQLDWVPDVIHCHDWTTGLLPLMLNTTLRDTPLARTATVFTIHNLEHQGWSPARVVDFARLPWGEFHRDGLVSNGMVNLMKVGLLHATKITTVSPTYAGEIRTPDGGFGLDGVLNFRAADLLGILNGIDDESWDPARDRSLPAHYSAADLAGKAVCKARLQQQLGLDVKPGVPLFGVVSRLAAQKGLDLLAEALPRILDRMDVQFVLLGNGEAKLENDFRWAADAYRGRFGAHLGFDGGLARLIQAGSDFFVMPSRSEPCGLTQMYAMRYGTPPVVRATGGLVDTVQNFVEGQPVGTGFVFGDATVAALTDTIGWACATYYDRPAELAALRLRGMAQDFSWRSSAKHYVDLYRWAVAARVGG